VVRHVIGNTEAKFNGWDEKIMSGIVAIKVGNSEARKWDQKKLKFKIKVPIHGLR